MLEEGWNRWRGYIRKIGMIGLIMLLMLPNMLINPVSEVFADEADYDILVDGETVTITKYLGTDTNVNIPEQIQGKDVTAIANQAFMAIKLDTVTIPETVTTIEWGAFMGCELDAVTFNEGLIEIGLMAFAGNKMENIDIPGTVTTIGDRAFSQGSLKTAIFNEGLKTIGSEAFDSNELTSVTIPEGVTTIGEKAFIKNKLEEVALPSTIISMGRLAFLGGTEGGNNIRTLTMKEGLSSIGENAFKDNRLELLDIPGSVLEIASGAFSGNELKAVSLHEGTEQIHMSAFAQNKLKEVEFPTTLKQIGIMAFHQNEISTLTLPDSVEIVGDAGFGFNPLTEVKVYSDDVSFGMFPFFPDPTGPQSSITLFGRSGSSTEAYVQAMIELQLENDPESEEFLYSFEELDESSSTVCGEGTAFLCDVNDDDTITITGYDVNAPKHVVIPDTIGGKTVTNIEEIAFRAHDLTGVELPNRLIEIGRSAFYWNSITTVTIPSGVTSVEDSAFSANLLVNVSIPDSVTTIETYAFYKNSLTEVTIPSGVDFVGRGAFSYNPLTIIHFEGTPTVIDSSAFHPGFFAYPDFKGWYTDENFEQAWDNTVPAPMTIYGKWEAVCGEGTAFNCKVNDDGNTITITGYTGSDTDVIIPSKIDDKDVTAIGEDAFAGKQLVTVELPYGVTIIGKQAFSVNELTSVTIMNDNASIEESAFEGNQTTPTDLTIYGCLGSTAEAHANDQGYSFAESLKAECLGMSLAASETNATNQDVTISVNVNKLPESIKELKWAKGEQTRAYFQGGGGQLVVSNAFTVSENDTYTVYVEDVLGRERIATIPIANIDKTAPIVTGVTDGGGYDEPVTISFNEGTAILNGITFTNGTTVELNGAYELIVTDEAGNETIVMFELKQSDYIFVANGSGTVMITGYRGADTSIEIPSTLDGKTVTAIGNNAFSEKSLEDVIIPGSIRTIGDYAFRYNNLASVTLSEGLETIGKNAFLSNVITELIIPDTVTFIDHGAFVDNNIMELTLGENVQTIAAFAFYIGNIQEVTIPESVQSIGMGAFQQNQIKEFTVLGNEVILDKNVVHASKPENPEQLMIRGYCGSTANELANNWGYSFQQLEADECLMITLTPSETVLTNEDVTVQINVVSDSANVVALIWAQGSRNLVDFQDEDGDSNIVTDNQFTVSANGIYTVYVKDRSGNEKVEHIRIDNIDKTPPVVTGVTSGEVYDEPVTISFDEGIATLNGIAFTNGATVEVNGEYELIVTDEAGNQTIVMFELKQSDYIFVGNGSGAVMITGYRGTDTEIEIPSTLDGRTVTAIGNYAFSGKNLAEVVIPDTVTSIGEYAFHKNELQDIEIPGSVKTIGMHAFYENHLVSVTFSEGLETIGTNAFWNNHIAELAIPDTVTLIGYGAFLQNNIAELTLGENVQTIAAFAFWLSNLQEVIIPESVQSIGEGAFRGNQIKEFTVLGNETMLNQNVLHDQSPENPEQLTIRGYCGSTANELAMYWGYSFEQLEANECLAISLTPSGSEPTNEDITVSIDVISDIANVVELKWAKGEQNLAYFQAGGGELVTSYEFTVSENDTYTTYVTDAFGRALVVTILISNIDKTPPEVTGVTDGEVYAEPVTISFNEGSATLNGAAFTNGTTVSVNGEYELIVTDEAGNQTNVMFELKQSDYIYVDNGSGTVMITGFRGTDTRLEIPNTLDGKTVTAIGDYAFSEKSLEHVTLPDSVTSIGAHAFYQNVLQVIEVPSSVTTIGKHAFDGNHIASVALSEGLETIGENAFLANAIAELTIPESVQSIAAGAFQHNPIQEFTVLSNEVALDQKVLHDQNPENPELVMIRGYCGSTANELANYWGYSFKQLEANECLAIKLTPSVTELTNEEIMVSIDVISAIANVVELKWAKGEQILTYFRDGNGNAVTDNQFTVSENGTYTTYVKDKSGNEKVEQIKIGNIDNSLLIIHVQIVDGKTVTIHANSSDSIQQLKQRLQDTEGIAPENQKMMFDGTVLEDGRTFADYNLPKEATVQLIILSTDVSLKQLGVALKDERAIELDLTQLDHDIGKTEQENIEIFATTSDSKAKVTLNGASFDKKQSLQLNVGENTFTMIVTAENGHEQTYTIKVNRQTKAPSPGGGGGVYIPSSDISLDQLEVIIDGENRLPFDPAQFEYDLGDTEAETAEIIVKAHHPRATITLDGEVFTDKKSLLLNEEKNIFNIVIIAENGDEQAYTITVNRLQKVPFIDIAGHWAEGFIKMSYWGDMFYGYPDKTFRPDDRISRMEVTSVLVRLLELDEQKQVPFIDVQSIGKEKMEELEKAYANGVVKGYPDQTFKPNTDVTRAHLALILYRTYEKVNGTPYKPKQLTYFQDIADYDQETQHAIAMLVELNIAEGYDWDFMPNEQATRAEAAKMLVRFKEVLGRLERV